MQLGINEQATGSDLAHLLSGDEGTYLVVGKPKLREHSIDYSR